MSNYGNWQQAKLLLDDKEEPRLPMGDDKKHLDVFGTPILGYPCQYIKNITKKGVRRWLVITNGSENKVYYKEFGEVPESDVVDIFNN